MSSPNKRPVFLNLLRIRQPVTAVLSILHRITGVLMALLIPGLIYLLDLSLTNEAGYQQVINLLNGNITKLVAVILCWALAHHLLAGIRFLLLDFDVAISRSSARITAWMTHAGAAIIALLVIGVLF